MALNYVQISGTFEDGTGQPLSGTASFVPNTTVYANGIPQLTPNDPIQAVITAGQLRSPTGGTLQLLATDNSGLSFVGQTGFLIYAVTVTVGGEMLPSWQFALPHGTLGNGPVDLYALANTPASGGGGGITPPAGDIGGTTNAPTVVSTHLASPLPIAQGGTGASSAPQNDVFAGPASGGAGTPAFRLLAASDIPALPYVPTSSLPLPLANGGTGQTAQQAAMDALAGSQVSGQYLRGNGTHVQMSAIQAADLASTANELGNAPLVVTPSGALQWGLPWQFYPEAYGAKGDGKVIGDAAISSGSLGTLTSASAGFTSADTGKTIMVNGANGTANAPLITTITYVSPTTVTLTAAAAAAVSAAAAFYASDDGPAFVSMCQAMQSYCISSGRSKAQAVLGDRFYGLVSLFQQSAGPLYNTHIPVLYPNVNGTTQQFDLEFLGAGSNGSCQFWGGTIPGLRGTCLVSMSQAPGTANSTYGQQSIMGGPTGGGAFTQGFANTHVTTQGLMLVGPAYPNQRGFDFGYLAGWSWRECSVQTLQSVAGNSPKLPELTAEVAFQSTIGIGFVAPLGGNNDAVTGSRLTVEGYETGGWVADHFTCDSLAVIYSDLALNIDGTHGVSGNLHAVTIANMSAEIYNGAIRLNGGSCLVNILLDVETTGGGNPSYDISDSGNGLHGTVTIGFANSRTSGTPVVSGAANLKVVNGQLGPGHWASPPAVPSSGTAQQNTAWRDATVQVSGGTVTQVAVDGTNTGLTSGMFRVPSGKTITLTYSAAPTWTWWLD